MNTEIKRNVWLIVAIAVQIAIIFVIIIFKYSTASLGQNVLLKVVPVDPHDILRGNYLQLKYDVSTLPKYYFPPSIYNNETVYIPLSRQGEYFELGGQVVTSLSNTNTLGGRVVYLKARIVSGADSSDYLAQRGLPTETVTVSYAAGEQYFIPEGTADRITFGSSASALLKVDDNGNSVLSKVYVNGKEI